MEREIREKYVEAGKANRKTLDYAKGFIREGRSLLEIAEGIEGKIVEFSNGKGKPAWPVNLSINENAAHQTASLEEEIILTGKEVLKVDVGVHIDGYISDAAITLDLGGESGKLVEAAESALEDAISVLEKTRNLAEIGRAAEKAIKERGFNPVQNLTGHFLEQWINHAPPSVPATGTTYDCMIDNDKVIAIEPFATNGEGRVKESGKAEIFMLSEAKPARNPDARKILKFIETEYKTLPFAERWISKKLGLPSFQRKTAFRELLRNGSLKSFPILHEDKGKLVAQAETSLIVEENEVTRLV